MPVALRTESDRPEQAEDAQPLMVEITPLESVSPVTVVLDQEPECEVVESTQMQTQPAEDVEEPRRRRRRSSAPSSS